jgi:hypothetical protein
MPAPFSCKALEGGHISGLLGRQNSKRLLGLGVAENEVSQNGVVWGDSGSDRPPGQVDVKRCRGVEGGRGWKESGSVQGGSLGYPLAWECAGIPMRGPMRMRVPCGVRAR